MENITGGRFVKDSAAIALFSVLTALTGLLVDILLASRFGMGGHTDAFYAAYTVPFLFSYIAFAIGQSTLVPVFSRYLSLKSEAELWRFFSTFVNIALIASFGVTLLGFGLAPFIASLVAPGLGGETASLAGSLCRILFFLVGMSVLAEVFRAFLYAKGAFVLASSSNFIRNGAVVLSLLAFSGSLGIKSAAYGYVAGYALQSLVLGVRLAYRYRPRYRLLIDRGAWGLRETRNISLVQVLGFLILQVVTLAERVIGSFLPAGSITALSYASRIVFMAVETCAGSIATSILPALSRAVAGGEKDEAGRLLGVPFRLSLLIFLPMTAFVFVLRNPLVELLYQRGAFTREATAITASVFMMYSLSLVFQGYNRLIHNCLYAEMNPRGSLIMFVALTVTTVFFDVMLVGPLGIYAMPAGYLIGSGAAFVIGSRLFIAKYHVFKGEGLFGHTVKVTLLSLLFGGILYIINGVISAGGRLGVLINLVFAFVASAVITLIAGRLVRLREVVYLGSFLRRRY